MTPGAISDSGIAEALRAETLIDQSNGPFWSKMREYRQFQALFVFLTLRDLTLRYRQTLLGVIWAVLQPILPVLVFTVIFSRVLRPQTGGVPYWLFALTGLSAWTFFANAIGSAGQTFVSNQVLLNKVYFPRAILPAAAVAACLVDWLVTGILLAGLLMWGGYRPTLLWMWIPVIVAVAVLLAMAVGVAIASLAAIYRDVKHVLPFMVQLWMFATPIVYPLKVLPKNLQSVVGLNPMAGVVEAFRYCFFAQAPDWRLLGWSALSAFLIATAAMFLFHRLEADLAERG